MTRTTRFTIVTMQTLIAAGWFTAVGCSSSNDPATTPATGGSSGSGGAAGTDSTGGSSGSATAGSGTGGATSGGSAGSGGSTSGSGGTGGSTGGSAGSAAAGSGGSATVTDGGGTGGSAGSGGASDGGTSALCGNTAAGMAIAKGGACTAADTQSCSKACGPESKGAKSETCTGGIYVEGKDCTFPDGDYSCYKIPTAIDAKCPATAPQSNTACDVPSCTLCNAGGATPSMGSYVDGNNMTKAGYCVCPEPKMAGGTRKWSCASTTAWPCPLKGGC